MKFSPELEKWRVQDGSRYSSATGTQTHGMFKIPVKSYTLLVLATDGGRTGWEHVSVSMKSRTPNWSEMCYIKSLFWDDEETVVQFHPKASEYVNMAPNVLHLWKNSQEEHKLPPSILVGVKDVTLAM